MRGNEKVAGNRQPSWILAAILIFSFIRLLDTQTKLPSKKPNYCSQQIFMYKTAEKRDIAQQYITTFAMPCCVIWPVSDICCFWCVKQPLTSVLTAVLYISDLSRLGLYGSTSFWAKSMKDGDFQPPTAPRPLNRFSWNLKYRVAPKK